VKRLTAFFVVPANVTIVANTWLFVLANVWICFSQAGGVQPLLTGTLALKHFVRGSQVVWIVRFAANAENFKLVHLLLREDFMLLLWNVLVSNEITTFQRTIHVFVRVDSIVRAARSLGVCLLDNIHFD
jgi:uncharacterized protein YhhL (DUF1145 family)